MEDYNNLVVGNKQILQERIVATEKDLSQMSQLKSDIETISLKENQSNRNKMIL